MTHDPLCPVGVKPWEDTYCCQKCSPGETPPWERACQCDLIATVRDEERGATVESAVYVASQSGAVPELVQLLSQLYKSPEAQMDEEVRREAARELTRLAQEMGMIP